MKLFHTFYSGETKELGTKFARNVLRRKPKKNATIFVLRGNLGSGKTTFIQGFMAGAHVKRRIISPTFIILRRFPVRNKFYKNIFHVDAYRLKDARELARLGFQEVLADSRNIVLIEWGERVKKILKKAKTLKFSHKKAANERGIILPF